MCDQNLPGIMESTSLFSSDESVDEILDYSSTLGDKSGPSLSSISQAAQLIRDAYLGFQDAPVQGYYDVCSCVCALVSTLRFWYVCNLNL